LPDMKDAWREQHPGRRAFTYYHPHAVSRVDRVHVSSRLLPQVAACRIADSTPSVSDHAPVIMQLLPSGPGVLGPGLRSVRLSMQSDAHCRRQLEEWIEAQQVPEDPTALMQWWPQFTHQLEAKVRDLNTVAKANQAGQGRAALREAAQATVSAARAHVRRCSDADLPAALQQVATASAALAQLMNEDEALARQHRRHQWVHTGERPSPKTQPNLCAHRVSVDLGRKKAGKAAYLPGLNGGTWFWVTGSS
jgi:hypothetical protein